MYLTLAWRNIWRNKRRTIITLSSIGFAVFFAAVMQSMQQGSYARMIDNVVRFSTGHVQIHAKGFWDERNIDNSLRWSDSLNNEVKSDERIAAIAPRLESFALGAFQDKTKGIMVIGVDPQLERNITELNKRLTSGEYFSSEDGVLVGKDLATYLDISLGDTLVLISQGYHGVNAAGKYPVEGILNFPSPQLNQQAAFLKLPAAQLFYGAPDRITSISVLLKDASDLDAVNNSLKAKLNDAKYEVMTWEEMMPELVQSIELDYYGGLIMISILYIVIAFGIFGTFLMMTKERTYEFGVLTAIGMRKVKIEIMVALEIIFLAMMGVLVGVSLSLPILIYLYHHPILLSGEFAAAMEKFGMEAIIPFSLKPSIFLRQGIIILVLAVLLGIYPMVAIQMIRTSKALKA